MTIVGVIYLYCDDAAD